MNKHIVRFGPVLTNVVGLNRFICCLGLVFYFSVPSAFSQPKTGDWIITGKEVVSNRSLTISGNIVIKNGGSLTLNNVTLRMNLKKNLQYKICAEPSSSLSVHGCRIDSADSRYRFPFDVEGAKFVLKNSELRRTGLYMKYTSGPVVEGNHIYHENADGLVLDNTGGATIRDNEIIHLGGGNFGIEVMGSGNNLIANNTLKDEGPDFKEGIFIGSYSRKNRVLNNKIEDYYGGIVLRNAISENYVAFNKIYKVDKTIFVAIYISHTPFPNSFVSNSVSGAYVGAYITVAKNTILAKNRFSRISPDPLSSGIDRAGTIFIYRCEQTYVLNNSIGSSKGKKGGITLFFSKNNSLKGNSISDCRYGISLFYGADNNVIENNQMSNNRANMIVEASDHNTIEKNNFIGAQLLQGYDSGNNTWSGNFWNDWTGTGPYLIPPQGRDPAPGSQKIAIADFKPPALVPDPSIHIRLDNPSLSITRPTRWKNKKIKFEWNRLAIEAGGKLVIENSTVTGASGWMPEPFFVVKAGGELQILKSKIIANPPESYIPIVVQNGGKITILDSELRNLGTTHGNEDGLYIEGGQAVIKNSIFKNNLTAIHLGGETAGLIVTDNIIMTGFFGIFSDDPNPKGEIKNNRIQKIADDFLNTLVPRN